MKPNYGRSNYGRSNYGKSSYIKSILEKSSQEPTPYPLRTSPNHILIDFAMGMWYLSRRYGQSSETPYIEEKDRSRKALGRTDDIH